MKKSDGYTQKSLPARSQSRSASATKKPASKSVNSDKKPVKSSSKRPAAKKKNAAVPVIASVAALAAVAGIAVAVMYFQNPQDNPIEKVFDAQIEVVMADGTTQTMNANAAYAELATDKLYPGIVIDGVDVGGMTKQEAYDAVMKVLPQDPVTVDVKLDLVGKTLKPEFKDITIEYNTAEIIDEAFAKYRPDNKTDLNSLIECYNEVQKLQNEKETYESTYTVKINNVREVVSNVLGGYVAEYAEVKDAVITGFDTETCEFQIEKEKKGYDINIDGTAKAVEDLFASGKYTGTITVPTTVKEPALTEEMIKNDFGLVGSEWTVTDGNDNRNNNISQACANINGKILEPGEVFSFNETVGQRTYDNGFLPATVISGGEYKQDLGGGICQVSTTLYNAVLMTDLEIVERHSHAWPSDYIACGLDATVDWPALDFKFRNDSDYQIVIVTWWDPSDSTCNAQIYGHKLPDGKTINTRGEIVSATPAGETEYIADPELPVGQTRTLRNAHQGITAYAYKVWYDAEGNEISKEFYNSSYYAAYGARIAVGVLRSDGSIATLDYSTGEVIDPNPPTPTPVPGPTVPPTPTPTPDQLPATPDPGAATT
ncbi:MAG: VanW family protein [Clostridiales bacterium]|nr:VanW family protein [Clostridiales bacterium]